MRTITISAIVVLALAQMASAAQTLTVNGEVVDEVTLKTGQSCIVKIVSDNSNPYSVYVGFDDRVVLGSFGPAGKYPEAGDLASITEYDIPAFYGFFASAAGTSPTPSPGNHFVIVYQPQQVGETELKLYDITLTSVIDSVHITVVPAQMGTAFTYQGRLMDADHPAEGQYDFEFMLYDAPSYGNQMQSKIDINDLNVIDGYFTVELDFSSSVFDGNSVWLDIGVRPGDSNDPNAFITLRPRQKVTPTPYALYAKTAGNALTGSGTTNRIAKFTGPNTLGDSVIHEFNGYIGMGTTNPRGKFDLDCDGGDIYLDTFSAKVYIGDVEGDGDETLFTVHDGGKFTFENGSVGIGTASPQEDLHIYDAAGHAYVRAESENGYAFYIADGSYNSGLTIKENGTTKADVYWNTANDSLSLAEGGVERLVVKDGKVGIGTALPSEKLDVRGNIDVSSNQIKHYYGFPRPNYDSGWVQAQSIENKLQHNIGGDPNNYVVDLQFKSPGGIGVNQAAYGGDNSTSGSYGAYWRNLTDTGIEVVRQVDNTSAEYIRVRIWVYD
jgi:hypothetical protein